MVACHGGYQLGEQAETVAATVIVEFMQETANDVVATSMFYALISNARFVCVMLVVQVFLQHE
ncbi:hypothetical protein BAY60_15360 [Prauserella muralis]|uniref:Uncharacterized protein n=1 Tax=Prauserella muralis TaxID=588067 RepID=A0A2V4B0T1_9PSEU|nr:hypothetical protein BAY60_15360 [Prauserella muralis]